MHEIHFKAKRKGVEGTKKDEKITQYLNLKGEFCGCIIAENNSITHCSIKLRHTAYTHNFIVKTAARVALKKHKMKNEHRQGTSFVNIKGVRTSNVA